MRWCVTSGGDEVRLRSYVNHYIWAHENDVDYRLDLGLAPGLRLPYDAKYAIIRRALLDYDWVMWVDDDVFFTRWSASSVQAILESAEAEGRFLVVAEGPPEPSGIWSRINSGVMLLRSDERTIRLLDRAQGTDVEALRPTWDFERDGLFSGGDQDALWLAIRDDPELSAGTSIVGHAELNSRPHLLTGPLDDVLNVHFCGGHKEMRIHEFARQEGLGLELVPHHLLDKYSVRRRDVSTRRAYVPLRLRRDYDAASTKALRKLRFVLSEKRWK
jgi:hypothetical protein